MNCDNAKTQSMDNRWPKTVGSTRLWRVQFGVPLNCHVARSTVGCRMSDGNLRWQSVSGATPETTCETRMLPHLNWGRWLPDMDLNHDKQIQSLLCYRYTIGQAGAVKRLNALERESRNVKSVQRLNHSTI